MQFNSVSPEAGGSLDLPQIRIDEQRDLYAAVGQPCHRAAKLAFPACRIDTAFGRDFFTPFGDQAYGMGTQRECYLDHRLRCRHFQIERQR